MSGSQSFASVRGMGRFSGSVFLRRARIRRSLAHVQRGVLQRVDRGDHHPTMRVGALARFLALSRIAKSLRV
jgi:hypothetical protein